MKDALTRPPLAGLLSTSASLRSRARFVSSPSDRHVLLKEASDLIFEGQV